MLAGIRINSWLQSFASGTLSSNDLLFCRCTLMECFNVAFRPQGSKFCIEGMGVHGGGTCRVVLLTIIITKYLFSMVFGCLITQTITN